MCYPLLALSSHPPLRYRLPSAHPACRQAGRSPPPAPRRRRRGAYLRQWEFNLYLRVVMLLQTTFALEPTPPFRLDLTVWALRRRPHNEVDRWDGQTYRRALILNGEP